MKVCRGVTRTVFVGRRWVVKVPRIHWSLSPEMGTAPWWCFARAWLANRSEWRQRDRTGVARPVLTFGHLAVVFPAAFRVAPDDGEVGPWCDHSGDEGKGSSWGYFPGEGWLLIDYDRAWEQDDRGLVGGIYYGRQERLARKWVGFGGG